MYLETLDSACATPAGVRPRLARTARLRAPKQDETLTELATLLDEMEEMAPSEIELS